MRDQLLDDLLTVQYLYGHGVLTPRQIPVLKNEWLKLSHDEFMERNRWSFYMAVEFLPIDLKIKYIPTDTEIEAVRKLLTPDQLFLFDFVEESGARIMEAVRLDWPDVKNDVVILKTRKAKNSNLTPRLIPKPECIKLLTGEGKVFKQWTAYPRFLEDKASWNWHALRQRWASIWATSGMSIFEIMVRLEHQNMQTTMRYLQLLGFSHSLANGKIQNH